MHIRTFSYIFNPLFRPDYVKQIAIKSDDLQLLAKHSFFENNISRLADTLIKIILFTESCIIFGLTVGGLLLGGSGKGGLEDLRLTTAPMAEISLSNIVFTVLVWTRVRWGASLACRHERMYCTQDRTGDFRRL